jgi:hypothetical protein
MSTPPSSTFYSRNPPVSYPRVRGPMQTGCYRYRPVRIGKRLSRPDGPLHSALPPLGRLHQGRRSGCLGCWARVLANGSQANRWIWQILRWCTRCVHWDVKCTPCRFVYWPQRRMRSSERLLMQPGRPAWTLGACGRGGSVHPRAPRLDVLLLNTQLVHLKYAMLQPNMPLSTHSPAQPCTTLTIQSGGFRSKCSAVLT